MAFYGSRPGSAVFITLMMAALTAPATGAEQDEREDEVDMEVLAEEVDALVKDRDAIGQKLMRILEDGGRTPQAFHEHLRTLEKPDDRRAAEKHYYKRVEAIELLGELRYLPAIRPLVRYVHLRPLIQSAPTLPPAGAALAQFGEAAVPATVEGIFEYDLPLIRTGVWAVFEGRTLAMLYVALPTNNGHETARIYARGIAATRGDAETKGKLEAFLAVLDRMEGKNRPAARPAALKTAKSRNSSLPPRSQAQIASVAKQTIAEQVAALRHKQDALGEQLIRLLRDSPGASVDEFIKYQQALKRLEDRRAAEKRYYDRLEAIKLLGQLQYLPAIDVLVQYPNMAPLESSEALASPAGPALAKFGDAAVPAIVEGILEHDLALIGGAVVDNRSLSALYHAIREGKTFETARIYARGIAATRQDAETQKKVDAFLRQLDIYEGREPRPVAPKGLKTTGSNQTTRPEVATQRAAPSLASPAAGGSGAKTAAAQPSSANDDFAEAAGPASTDRREETAGAPASGSVPRESNARRDEVTRRAWDWRLPALLVTLSIALASGIVLYRTARKGAKLK